MRRHPAEVVERVMGLHRSGLTGRQIAGKMGFPRRDTANYIIRCQIGPRPRSTRKTVERRCARCGRVDVLEPYHAKQAKHCSDCRTVVAAAANKAAHTHKWTTSNCRWCGTVFPIYRSNLEAKWRAYYRRFPNAARASWTPFCGRRCYDEWQKNGWKRHGQ